ncbi:NUDIX hydrolase [Paenibacillus camelliae]|uniref:NUDIX hydrolase n=1 Tax=Paenibacillus camelliae TaxID=512410 RepID=UPI00203FDFF8|nr:NUDIX domain-containing protein [Paenibacillus camelliae]MCM3633610.1 NUDIX domain-containing protein [Paenibacillus camelliae]
MKYRAVALCIVRREDQYLLVEKYDEVLDVTYYRPVGGTIEYGEDSKSTVIREVREEISAEISEPILVSVIENIYPYGTSIGHDINFIYEAGFIDESFYTRKQIIGTEGEESFNAIWIDLATINKDDKRKLVPEGLMTILTEENDSKLSEIKHYRTR